MTVDQFLTWANDRPGRYEMLDGEVFAMSPQRAQHARAKSRIFMALHGAVRAGGISCEVFPDGMTVRVDPTTAFEPDALVVCGSRLDADAVEVNDPSIVVEVISPSTKAIDTGAKFTGYFSVASVMHYLIVDPVKRLVIHHRRGTEVIETRIIADGALRLDPPGLDVPLAEMFDDA
jgi:Uma2 family endonuclease